ncbi:transglutaminaseTgpA domain-containing protein [Gaiella sp.]|uniref:DUF3488 and transglutaminase-like domain-containing protein n=1 Tax=Gaiella sp. TaxID=2663207 RepID=UPI0032670EF2
MPSGRARRLVAASLPVIVVMYAWATLEVDASPRALVAVAGVALVPSLPARLGVRITAAALAWLSVVVVIVQAGSASVGEIVERGLADAYALAPPFVATAHTELAVLVALLAAMFALGVAVTAGDRPFVAAVVIAAGVGTPATINPSRNTIAMGSLALLAVLWPVAVAAAPDRAAFGPGVAVVSAVTVAAVVLAGIGARPSVAALDWRSWDLFGESHAGRTVALVWSSNYAGIDFPPGKTTVLRVTAPRRSLYWRATTLDSFAGDRWIEALYSTTQGGQGRNLPPDELLPEAAAKPRNWVEQQVEVRALLDDHVIAAAQPVAIDTGSAPPPRVLSGGVMVKTGGSVPLRRYTVWSYAPRPTPAQLVKSPASYPRSLSRYLDVGRPTVPPFGTPSRASEIESLFTDVRFRALLPYRATWREARRLTVGARSPYEATIAIERWLRSGGGFVYDERPPLSSSLPPLADFQQRTKRGYCQHFAGAMALMLRYLGVPARVAVGFSSGTWKDDGWTVTDHDAHAWVEVWFAGFGWLPFDPTPGRGTLSATYTNASDSADAIRALGTGRFLGSSAIGRTPTRRGTPAQVEGPAENRVNWLGIAPFFVVAALLVGLAGAKYSRQLRWSSVRDPRGRASAARAELAAFMCDQGAPVTSSAPVSVLVGELRGLGVGSDAFANAFSRARYGPPAVTGPAADETRAELRKLLSVLRVRLGPARRLRGFLAVKSLRRS